MSDADWLSASFNHGWTYSQRIAAVDAGRGLVELLAVHYTHSSRDVWQQRLQAGQIRLNGELVRLDQLLASGDQVCWQRPPWLEAAVPASWEVIFDDGDLLVVNKPSGLPVIPGGGFLDHTLTGLLQRRCQLDGESRLPRPVHRLGRFTSGLLICARQRETRAKLSAMFRRATAGDQGCKKIYRALAHRNLNVHCDEVATIRVPIVQTAHPMVGKVWVAADSSRQHDSKQSESRVLTALSTVRLLERRQDADLLEVAIQTGRPHQIRIHLAAIGSPLIGDPLYGFDGQIASSATPGDGGYCLHAHRLLDVPYRNRLHGFTACSPRRLQMKTER